MSNVLSIDSHAERQFAELRSCLESETAGREAMFRSCELLAPLRAKYPSDRAFNVALAEHDCEIQKDERAARIRFGQLPRAGQVQLRMRYDGCPSVRWMFELADRDGFSLCETEAEHPHPADLAESAPVEPEPAKPLNQEGEKQNPPVKVDKRSLLAELPAETARAFLTAAGGDYKHGGLKAIGALVGVKAARAFLCWWAERLASGAARSPLAKNEKTISAPQVVPNLPPSFRGYLVVWADGEPFSKKRAGVLMAEFDGLVAAAAAGLTQQEYARKKKGLPVGERSTSGTPQSWSESRPAPTASAAPLPPAMLADGTQLVPRPIVVCGGQVYPSEIYSEHDRSQLGYAEAYVFAHVAREMISQLTACGMSHDAAGMLIAHHGMKFARVFPGAGKLLSSIATRIRAEGSRHSEALWFSMEEWRQKTSDGGSR